MLNLSERTKIITGFLLSGLFLMSLPFILYLKIIPAVVSNQKAINFLQSSLYKTLELDLSIKKPVLKTELSPVIAFRVDEISLSKDKLSFLLVKKLDIVISLSQVMKHRILVKKAGIDYIFADIDKLSTLSTSKKESKKSDWYIDLFDSLLYIKECYIVLNPDSDTNIKIKGNNLRITDTSNPKYVNFNISTDIKRKKDTLHLFVADEGKVFIQNHKLYVKDCFLHVNNSKVLFNYVADNKNNYDMKISSEKFDIKNVIELLEADFIIPNGAELLACFKDISGNFDFNINFSNDKMNGRAVLNNLSLKVIPINNIPVIINQGTADITADKVTLKDFKGYYGKQKKNTIDFSGTIKDYYKSFDTDIVADTTATKELTTDYLSKVVGYPLELTGGDSKTRMIIKFINNKLDMVWLFKLAKGKDILVGGSSLSPVNYDRALKADLHVEGTTLTIKSIDYYIASVLDKSSKGKVKPILSIYGNMDISSSAVAVKNLGFEIPRPLPSEFLNVLIGQRMFKKGTIAGHLQVINTGKYPVLEGRLEAQKVRIPSQRLSVRDGIITAKGNAVHLNAFGRYKRSDYKLTGNIVNEIKFPVIVKNINLTVDNIDVERILQSFNQQNTDAVSPDLKVDATASITDTDDESAEDDNYTFNTGLLIVEECVLNVVKGVYKELNFGNVKANLTLDKNGILKVTSNRFDIAEGISSCKVLCDLKNHKYSIRLGVKDINSDIMATSLLELKKEISGKASGLIELNTDDSLKLNGSMKFAIKNGTIGKVGFVEYILKVASLFRNPMAMISPSTLVDLVNIPEGNFDKIIEDLQIKDNVIERIMIKSSAPQLSSFIVGRFDLETRDATLRIYTKFSNKNKGMAGFLRNISLNSLANRVPMSSRNDSNYYSAELAQLPAIDADEKDCQVFLTKVDGDVEQNNFLSSLKRIK